MNQRRRPISLAELAGTPIELLAQTSKNGAQMTRAQCEKYWSGERHISLVKKIPELTKWVQNYVRSAPGEPICDGIGELWFESNEAMEKALKLYETVTAAIRSLERHGRPLPATIVSLRHLIDRVRAFNVHGDRDIDSQIAQLEQALGPRRRRDRITVPPLEQALLRLQDTCKDAVSEAFTVDPLLARFSAIDLDGAHDAATKPAAQTMVPLLGGIGA